ncbi:MAG: DNA/RNA helicase domain-containing protein [Chloroflexota bacterium]
MPKSDFWASAKEGIDQVGCVYTAQGFEFDYVGVIFGPDLVYRPMDGGWVGQRHESCDRIVRRGVTDAEFAAFVESTYRVLLTRGLRGCYVYCIDSATRDFFLSRTEGPTAREATRGARESAPNSR